ncbi:MAG: HAMP domain-containing histidine kinase [Methanospirillaceae archaeon]|nr:HAMP domain-containing histidine kinase [Methanospirillaceae archaeon]
MSKQTVYKNDRDKDDGNLLSFPATHMHDIYLQTDNDLFITLHNPAAVRDLAIDSFHSIQGDLLGSLFVFQDEWNIFTETLKQNREVQEFPACIKKKDGSFFIGLLSFHARGNKEDTAGTKGVTYEGCIFDITKSWIDALLTPEREITEFTPISDSAGFWVYDPILDILLGSETFYLVTRLYPRNNALSLQDLIPSIPASDQMFLLKPDENKSENNPFLIRGVTYGKNRQDKQYFELIGKRWNHDARNPRFFGFIHDKTQSEIYKQSLVRYTNEFEEKNRELEALRTQLLDMNRDLEQRINSRTKQIEVLLNQKDEFIIQIGHDIRTPLTPLHAILPLVRRRIRDPQCQNLLDIAISDVQSITQFVNHILTLAQDNTLYSQSDIIPLGLHDTIENIITNHSYLIYQKSIEIQNIISPEITIGISPLHFEAIFERIIDNAVKYSYISGTIEITATILPDDESIGISVRDYGIGIQKEDLTHIFDDFYMADKSRHERDSYGLGLSIAKRIIHIYHGSIHIASDGPGLGTIVTVRLPLTTPQSLLADKGDNS